MTDNAVPERSSTLLEDPDTLFDALAHQRRRHAIAALLEHDPPITLPDLADEVAVRERETALTKIPAETVKRIYLSLYHSHVPKLADAGIVEYSQEQDMVVLLADAETVETLLAPLDGE